MTFDGKRQTRACLSFSYLFMELLYRSFTKIKKKITHSRQTQIYLIPCLELFYYPGVGFWSCFFYSRLPSLLVVMAIFGKSHDLKTKTPKTQAACIFLRWNKCQREECIQRQKLTYGFVEIFIEKAMTQQKLYDIINFKVTQITTNPPVRFSIRMHSTLCVASGPNKVNCENRTGTPGISMQYLSKDENLRQKWTQFVGIFREDLMPKKSSCLCSAHFEESCFKHKPVFLTDGSGKAIQLKKMLIEGSVPL